MKFQDTRVQETLKDKMWGNPNTSGSYTSNIYNVYILVRPARSPALLEGPITMFLQRIVTSRNINVGAIHGSWQYVQNRASAI